MYRQKARRVIKALALACWLLMAVLLTADCLAEPMETRIVAAHGGLNVRREPTTQSQRVYTLDETDVVVILEWHDGWALVGNNTPPYLPIGWANGDYLR